ncbi:hypothetical protein GCM10016455_26820 [Aliiroseovarius zhejiangensis]|uniref:Uncharacterized protein n=1 Tax=Aliiroseovarius zhejiangensis TaxID=1632025 RepID=A0ABQ3JA18_9RHOB|nr:hypothetical protein [Aliiroseovarius zhejiangensis]GHF04112.1 hypothetical protein GCM10016455_26820 [Aliiroseovarius zhejiangensis]
MGREVANRHGWQRTGRRIMDRVERALGAAEVHDEFGTPFVWLSGTYQDRIRYRGLENRTIRDVSRTEVAAILDEISADLKASEDPAGDLARPGLGKTVQAAVWAASVRTAVAHVSSRCPVAGSKRWM